MRVLNHGQEVYWIYDYPGRLTAERAVAVIEAELGIEFPRGDYKFLIKTTGIGDEQYCDVTITRKENRDVS